MDFIDDDDDNEEIITEEDIANEIAAEMFFSNAFDAASSSSDESSNAANADAESTTASQTAADASAVAASTSNPLSSAESLSGDELKLFDEFSLEKFTNELLSKSGSGDLRDTLYNHWKKYVPICFCATENPTSNLIERNPLNILIKPLENYICNSLDSEKALKSLSELDDPPQLCGKVFKSGEPSYFCRDCGNDPTCVLCSSCFRQSKHRNHRYKMMTSAGGGYCDCGDPEAWKKDPYCEQHKPKSAENANEDATSDSYVTKLPTDLAQRATELFTFVLEYVFDMLSFEKDAELPEQLKHGEAQRNDYVTMLYNDEVHSYDQVVSTLKKCLKCDDKKSFEYAAIVDKEGRSVIKRSNKVECMAVKNGVEVTMSGSVGPLKTKVFQHALVSHQYFAERLVAWLQKVCDYSKGLKNILCKVGLYATPDSHSVIERIMLADNVLWKSARAITHQFFIAIYFMDPNWKREFAVIYSRNYKLIWRNYIKNHDETVSLTDLAVQMFTVISLSKYLIAKHNLLQTIMETLIEHSKTTKGKLNFPRTRNRYSNYEFKRAQYILFDFKYCLTLPPDEWTDELRKSFINGFKTFVEFLRFMHGMDPIVRYTQQHIEFEPEWETSFNLLIKLQKSIVSLIEWCSTDRHVFLECYKLLLNAIHQTESNDAMYAYKFEKRKFNGHHYEIIDYPVIEKEVSIHAPLTRLFAGLYAQLNLYSLNYSSIFNQLQSASTNPLSSLKHELPKEKMICLVEPSLRSLVLVSQTNSGLWKRNGFSLISQVYFYSNIKCRHEMFDRDLLNLQMGASVMDPNEFLINALVRFNLFDYFTDETFEAPADAANDCYKAEFLMPLAEDFLELLIHVVSERFEPNMSQISPTQKLEREAIHQLCISPMAHSDLVKNIYSDNEKYTNDLESVLQRIAMFKNSSMGANAKGTYELREQYLDQYSPYFYHYIKSEKTKSEEYQMSLRKSEKEKFFKPPVPPKWTQLFQNVSYLLDSDVFIKLMFATFRRFASGKSKLMSESLLAKLLHLIGLALHEEQADIERIQAAESETGYLFKFIDKAIINSKRPSSGLFSFKVSKTEENLNKYLTDIVSNNTLPDQIKLLADWTLDYAQRLTKIKNKQQQAPTTTSGAKSSDKQANEEDDEMRAATSDEAAAKQSENALKEKRKNEIAEKRRAKILAQFNQMQKNFIVKNKEFYDETGATSNSDVAYSPSLSSDSQLSISSRIVCIGSNQTLMPVVDASKTRYRCILCQEDQNISIEMPPMVLCCYVQSSRVLSKNRKRTIDDVEKFDPLFMDHTLFWGINTTSCGHVMHAQCWQKYVDTVRMAENRRHARINGYSVKRNEYLCPLCETIGNAVLPLFPDLKSLSRLRAPASPTKTDQQHQSSNSKQCIALSYEDWLDGLEKTLENSVKKELQDDKDVFIINPCPLSTITKLMADAVASNFKLLFDLDSFMPAGLMLADPSSSSSTSSSAMATRTTPTASPTTASAASPVLSAFLPSFLSNELKLNSETVDIMESFTRITYSFGLITYPDDSNSRMPIVIWTNCAYTLQSVEQLLRIDSKPLFGQLTFKQSDLLSNIVKQAALFGVSLHSDTVRKCCVRLLASILPYKTGLFEATDIMKIDMFHFLVYLSLSMPNLYDKPKLTNVANGSINDSNIFRLALQAHCVQILLAKLKTNTLVSSSLEKEEEEAKQMETDDESSSQKDVTSKTNRDEERVLEFFNYLIELLKEKNIYEETSAVLQLNAKQIEDMLKVSLMPFLRCCALFFSNLTDLVPSVVITNSPDELNNNFNELLTFLGISNGLSSVLDTHSSGLRALCNHWITNAASLNSSSPAALAVAASSAAAATTESAATTFIDYPVKINEFIELPNDYVDLISLSMTSHVCTSSGSAASRLIDSSSDPATILCLICGETLCNQTLCCQQDIGKKRVGVCTAHAYRCCGTVGAFLRIAECQVLLMHLNMNSEDDLLVRGCFLPAPYLDDYGETDQGLRRGNPLRLCKSRYNKLYRDWLSHAIPDEVSRSYQNNQSTMVNIDWVQL